MKSVVRLALAVVLVALCSPFAYSNCLVAGVGNVLDNTDDTTHITTVITFDLTGYPAAMSAGGTNQLASDLVIYDDNTAPNCFSQSQVLSVLFSAPVVAPSAISVFNLTAYDSQGPLGLLLTTSMFPSGGGTVATFRITRAGTPGNLAIGGAGSAIVLHGFTFDLTNVLATSVEATVFPLIGTATPSTVSIGHISQAGPLTISPSSVVFPDQIVGATSAAMPIAITNTGNLAAPFPGGFMLSNTEFGQTNNCGTSLAGGATCTVNVTFTPVGTGTRIGNLTIGDTTPGGPHVIGLSGNAFTSPGVPAITSISPSRIIAGGPGFTLTVQGTNFAQGSAVLWNSSPRVTTFVNATTLTAAISATDIALPGTATISVSNGGQLSSNLTVQVQTNPITASAFVYSLPHIVQGQGFVTKITLVNTSGVSNSVTINYLDQTGALLSAPTYTIPPFGTLRVATPESARSGPSVIQWVIVGSSSPLAANSFFELMDSLGNVINTVGFNAATPLTDFSVPVEFEKTQAGTFIRTVGVALANPTATPSTATMQLLNAGGTPIGQPYTVALNAFGQTAIDLSQVPGFASVLPADNFVGSLAITSRRPIAAIALGDDIGPFAATPAVIGRAYLGVDNVTSTCPLAAQVAQFNLDFTITFEQDQTAGTLVCRAAEGSADLTLMQFRAYQALRVIREGTYDAQFPFTAGASLYDWMRTGLLGIRFRGDITTSSCCNPPRYANVSMAPTSTAMQTTGWLGPLALNSNAGLDTLITTLLQQARSSQGFFPNCGANDSSITMMGIWAVALDFSDFLAAHSGRFFDDSVSGEFLNRYRQVAISNSNNYVVGGNFCSFTPNVQTQPANLDFGVLPQSTVPVLRTVVINSAGTPFFSGANAISGTNASDFSIVSDTCNGSLVPPGCTIQVGFAASAAGQRSATLNLGTPPNMNVPLTGFATSATAMMPTAYTYVLPHIVTGNGYVTKITIANLSSLTTTIYVRYFSQSGQVVKTDTYSLPGGGAVRIATPESGRFSTPTTQWAIVGSSQPMLANLFFEVKDSNGTVINTVGFNSAAPLPLSLFPVEFQPAPNTTKPPRTSGVAIANPGPNTVSFTLQLVDQNGNIVTSFPSSLPPFGQVAYDLSANTAFGTYLPAGNFVGIVRLTANGPLSAIALEGDFGPFSATPVISQ